MRAWGGPAQGAASPLSCSPGRALVSPWSTRRSFPVPKRAATWSARGACGFSRNSVSACPMRVTARTFPGYGWLFPGADGEANVGIGVGLGNQRQRAQLREELSRFCSMLRAAGDLAGDAQPGPVIGGWLRMGGTGTPPAAGNVLLVGDAAGLVNPLQGEGIAPAMLSARLAALAVLADPAHAGRLYTDAVSDTFGRYMPGAAALQGALLRRPRAASAGVRLLTAPVVRHLAAGTWSLYWNGLVDGARPRPSAWAAGVVQGVAGRLAARPPPLAQQAPAVANSS